VCTAVFAAVLAAIFVPFLVVAPGGVWGSVVRQATRPLQIESTGAALLVAAHRLWGLQVTVTSSHGSQNLAGAGPDAIGAVFTALELAALVAVWILFARGPADRERFVRASAAAVCAFVALGKVLSPQFVIWLLPLVPLVRGRRGIVAAWLLGVAAVLTQLWFPSRYWSYANLDGSITWIVLARDLVLVALAATLVWPERHAQRLDPVRAAV